MAPFRQKNVLAHERLPVKIGRPSEYKPEYCDQVVEFMGQGYSLTAFAGSIKVAKQTLYDWMTQHQAFSDAVSRGRSTRVSALEKKLLSARYGAQGTTAIFALRNADPSEWKDTRSVTHDHNVTLQTMSDEQLLEIAQGRNSGLIDVSPKKGG